MGYVNQCEVWVPQLLMEIDFMNVRFFFQRHERDPFLKRLITEMRLGFYIKKCIENALDLRTTDLQLVAKSGLHPKKVKSSILENDQLDKLKDVIAEKQPKLANRRGHHDNAKPHIILTIREKLLQID
ncbi:uncharacterized protein LOC122719266 [Apis laboriosa]|uniref:uncharacterized protein LOC122719266 n=1 Tax=Apis laboriosa TaxID=183418 RepID=UPI001CC748B9|nr:uncharacterized protein LOC122719266 [Apis laboriosa]